MEFIGIRIGWLLPYEDEELRTNAYKRAVWLSPRDAVRIFSLAIEQPAVDWGIVFATSSTAPQRLSLRTARELLGYEPEDDVRRLYG